MRLVEDPEATYPDDYTSALSEVIENIEAGESPVTREQAAVAIANALVCDEEGKAGVRLTAAHAALAVVPTIVYGVFSLIMTAKKIYTGPYFFFRIDRQPWHTTVMWMAVIVVGNFVVSWLLTILQNLLHKTL